MPDPFVAGAACAGLFLVAAVEREKAELKELEAEHGRS